jgi:hypothetical protein
MGLKSRRSIGDWCQHFRLNINERIHSLGHFIYNREHQKILGRDGKQWSMIKKCFLLFVYIKICVVGKLAAFYFFFYIGLGGFFCLYLSIFMSFLPLNQPRCIGKESRLTSRAHPLSPGFVLFVED